MNRPLFVGLFVLAGLALFATGLFMIGNRHEAFARHMNFYTEFSDLSGIAKGAKVQVAGMDAGEVLDVGIPNSPASRFRVRFRINEKLHGLVRADSIVTIGTEGVVGDKFLSVGSGSPQAPVASADATLASKKPTELSTLLDQAKGTIADIDSAVRNANNLVTNANGLVDSVGGNLNSALNDVKTTVSNANEIVVGIKQGRGTAGMLLRDDAVADKVRQAVTNAQDATVELHKAAAQANALISDVQSRGFPKKIDDTLAGVKDIVNNFDATSQQVRQTVAEFTGPDQNGVTAGVNLRESLSSANTATGNMADETEALKHNFFFRGFFHKRGYYNLTHLSPDLYRKDRLFAAKENQRSWFKASDLFRRNSDGTEDLTPQGKSLLASKLAEYGGTIIQAPIVIEGYCDMADRADRLAISRTRSLFVRNYVRNHFQLDPAKIGAVALEDRPPAGLAYTTWDGVTIVLLKAKP